MKKLVNILLATSLIALVPSAADARGNGGKITWCSVGPLLVPCFAG
jgi:hypothetical protein